MNPKDYRRQIETQHQVAAAAAPSPRRQSEPDWAKDLDQLMDTSSNPDDREAALWRLQSRTFLVGRFAPYRPRYLLALQTAATDADESLRHAAFDVLANSKDDFARRKLEEGLRDPGK